MRWLVLCWLAGNKLYAKRMLRNVYFPVPITEKTYGTNPEYPRLNQCVTLSVGMTQINKWIRIPRSLITRASPTAVNDDAFERTLSYLYNNMRTGIYVLIKRGRLAMFAPFVNPDFRNDFHIVPPAVFDKGVEPDVSKWWANANILCNIPPVDFVSDHGWMQHLTFLLNVCTKFSVPDSEFFLNKRDSPQLRKDRKPVFPSKNMNPFEGDMLPIMSPYVGDAYEDVAWPLMSDFAFLDPPVIVKPWDKRLPSAVFRGTSTGPLTNNPRVDLCKKMLENADLLDARLTAWNTRDRLDEHGNVVKMVKDPLVPCSPAFFLRMEQQMCYKYAVYVQGHSAASRYLSLMLHGFVILKVETRGNDVADKMWYFKDLVPMKDHVPVKADLSDLFERIEWLRRNDKQAEKIANAAMELGMSLNTSHHAYAAVKLYNLTKEAKKPSHWLLEGLPSWLSG